jgi:hypothetical protein
MRTLALSSGYSMRGAFAKLREAEVTMSWLCVGDKGINPAKAGSVKPVTNPALKNRPLAGLLAFVYIGLFGIAGYLESIKIEEYWPVWLFIAAAVIWFATMMVLPFLVVQYFFGLDISVLWRPFQRFTIRKMLIWTFWISVFIWYFSQMQWLDNRKDWRRDNQTAVRLTQGKSSPGFLLRLMGDPGESRIEIKNATKEQIAEAQRLFPEATVVATGNVPDRAPAAPAAAPVVAQPAAGSN